MRALAIIGSASALRALIGILRLKIIAALLGPAGVGLFGLFSNLQASVASVAGLGLNFGGVRQIAQARDDPAALSSARQALFFGNLILGLATIPAIYLARDWIAITVFEDPARARDSALIGIGALLLLMAGSQAAVLQALGFIKPLAWLSVIEIALATAIGAAVLMRWQYDGIIVLVLLAPALNFLIGLAFVIRNAGFEISARWAAMAGHLRQSISISVAQMAGTSVALLTVTFVLVTTGQHLGTGDVGRLQAAMTISGLTASFLLAAMQTDYYPRLVACAHDMADANALINQQTRLGLLVSGPILIGLAGTADYVIPILFSADFAVAASTLGWWLLSDTLLIPAWAVGFLMVAHRYSRAYFITQLLANLAFLAVAWGLLRAGYPLPTLALGKIAMTGCLLGVSTLVVARRCGFAWSPPVLGFVSGLILTIVGLRLLAATAPGWAALCGVALAGALGLYSLRQVTAMSRSGAPRAARPSVVQTGERPDNL